MVDIFVVEEQDTCVCVCVCGMDCRGENQETRTKPLKMGDPLTI
jgi:hypothetical protein